MPTHSYENTDEGRAYGRALSFNGALEIAALITAHVNTLALLRRRGRPAYGADVITAAQRIIYYRAVLDAYVERNMLLGFRPRVDGRFSIEMNDGLSGNVNGEFYVEAE